MGNAFKTFAAVAFVGACLLDCAAASDENQYVVVSCNHPDVEVIEVGDDFFVLAPGKPETFSADVMVTAINGWQLLEPPASRLPVRMLGGSNVRYKVAKPPESERGGVIHFHNYIIMSNHDEGAKNIAVPAGANVIYTAYRDGSSRTSNWNVEGEDKRGYSSIVFNRNWWNVPSWFAGTMTTPRPRTYSVRGNDVDFITLYETGEMKVVGIRQIALTGGTKSSERMEPPAQDETWQETEVIYSEPCAVFDLTATLEPNVTQEEFAKVKSSISWTFASGNVEWSADDPLHATCHSPGRPGEYIVTASCGTASRIILVKVGTLKIHKVIFLGNAAIIKDNTATRYDGPDWQDNNLDGVSDLVNANARLDLPYHPIAFLSTNRSAAVGTFKPNCSKVSDSTKHVLNFDVLAAMRKARFAWNDDSGCLEWSILQPMNGDEVGLLASRPFEDSPRARYDPSAELVWEVGFGEQGTQDQSLIWSRSVSQHELHLTFNAKISFWESVYYLSCLNSSGLSSASAIVDGVWRGFAGLDVKLKGGAPLTYYRSYLTSNDTVVKLFLHEDGQCAAWAELFQSALMIQGVTSRMREIRPTANSGADGFLVETWRFTDIGTSGDLSFPYRNGKPIGDNVSVDDLSEMELLTAHIMPNFYLWKSNVCEVEYETGHHAQNNPKPASWFMCHYVVEANGKYYDPSYGCIYNSESDVMNVLSGFWKESPDRRDFFLKPKSQTLEIGFTPLRTVPELKMDDAY